MIEDIRDITSFKWGTVTTDDTPGPLAVRLDGDTTPLVINDSLIDPLLLEVGDRVRVELTLRKAVIHGKAGGAPIPAGDWVGRLVWHTSSTLPDATWVLPSGQALLRASYPDLNALYAADGYPYGAGNGSTTFNVPDFSGGRAPVPVQSATSIGTATFANATDLVTRAAHGLVDGDRVYFTGGTMPTGLTASTRYFVRNSTLNTFQLSATPTGSIINFTSDGSGTRTLFSDNFPIGYAGGEKAHTITSGETARTYANIRRFAGDANDYLGGSSNPYGIDATYTSGGVEYSIAMVQGGERPHNTMSPYLAVPLILKALA